MPQTAIIQPATPKGPPQTRTAGTPGKKEQNGFSPHLDKAVSNTKKQQQANRDESRTTASAKTDKKTSSQYPSPSPTSQGTSDLPDDTPTANTVNNPDGTEATPEQLAGPVFDAEPPEEEFSTTVFSQPQQLEPSAHRLQDTPSAHSTETVLQKTMLTQQTSESAEPKIDNAIPSTAIPAVPAPAIPETKAMPAALTPVLPEPIIDKRIQPTATKDPNLFIDQLQRIIDQADEAGTVSITKAAGTTPVDSIRNNINGILLPEPPENPSPVLVSTTTGSSAAAVNDLFMANADGAEKATARPGEQLSGIRQDSQQQYFNPKTATKTPGDASQNPQEQRRGDDLPQQGMGTGPQTGQVSGLSSGTEQSNTFSQMVTTSQPAATPPTTPSAGTTAGTTFLPSGVPVQESEIMQQLSNRLQLSGRNMDSRINLKLHPVELGSLKIDLTVKEGSIRANVVAQSQHTSEILEKNMTKLKSILENQGFTVDEISVTAESDSVNDFNLFDGQLFGQNDYAPKTRKGRREDEPIFTLANNVFAAPAMSTGVNVKI
ncbi:hypothetical protein FCL47_11870 [Desulfopila sp. IMCC35006]|uniref:flagellar hook-length control protein FliK n=1 Tax=Desulfopila sp. IMCC35006 TaxID=2569542 RepID=UPI0010AC0E81|nr:flagellar hook-length control protein FliK [Desulfopila sp. IMCC35006]TKB25797.1 hypothetical protein FCL47_11870 [Desulfopila sp. IMCC35006]